MIDKNDWRLLRGQINYLQGVDLVFHSYIPQSKNNDHDHCAFCMQKFSQPSQYGYSTINNYTWICPQCFQDFRDMFHWNVISKNQFGDDTEN